MAVYQETQRQLTVYDFISPFSGALSSHNRWVVLAQKIDWYRLEEEYAVHFSKGGKRAIGVRCAFGSLVIKKVLGLSDAQTVLLIAENPYLQYFIGLSSFCKTAPFSARTMSGFRRRIPEAEVTAAAKLMQTKPRKKRAAKPQKKRSAYAE